MTNTIIKGSDLMLFYNGKSVAFATSNQLSLSGNAIEVSSKDHGDWTTKIVGKLNWSVTSDNLYTQEDFTTMVDLWIAKTAMEVVFTVKDPTNITMPNGGWTPKAAIGYKGSVIITSITANAGDGDNATYSITLDGTGALTKVTV